MQDNIRLRRGRGRANVRGGRSLSLKQPGIPALPPFLVHHQQYFDSKYALTASQSLVYRGRGLSIPGSGGPYIDLPGLSSRGSRGLSCQKPRGLSHSVSKGVGPTARGAGLSYLEPESDRQRGPKQRHFIASLPQPRPNTVTQEEWYVFNHNGRPVHESACAVVCCCTFGEGNGVQRIFSFCCGETSPEEHTEKKALQQIIMLENGSGRELTKVMLISSRSPCIPCSQDMITFVKSRGFSMNLYFTALEKRNGPGRCGIRLLASFGIPMQITDDYIWNFLTSLLSVHEGKPKTTFSDGSEVDKVSRRAWDQVWSQQLGAVMNRGLPNVLESQSLCDKFNDIRREMVERETKGKDRQL